MILQRLVNYYDRLAADPNDPMTPSGFTREKISFELVLEPDGSSAFLHDIRETQGKKLFPRVMVVPDRGGRSGKALKPNFLWDNSGYVLGRDSKGKADRSRLAFESFRDFHIKMAESIDDPELAAVVKFLTNWSPDRAELYPLFAEALDKNIVFRIRGVTRFVHQAPEILNQWKAPVPEDEVVVIGQSLVGGDTGPLARLHPLISGVKDAQTMGAAIASFNLDAFTSYGLRQTYNAPVSVADAFKYTTALNRLLENRHRRMQLGDATVVFWAERPTLLEDVAEIIFGDVPAPKADAPAEDIARAQQVKVLLTQLRDGHANAPALSDSDVGFYLLGLSPNASRISIRFWVQTTIGEMQERLAQHLRDTELTGARPDDPPMVIRRIVQATGRAEFSGGSFKGYDADAVPPLLTGSLARAVFQGTPYPPMLLGQMLNRIRADGHISHVRVATIKACLIRKYRLLGKASSITTSLNAECLEVPYVAGRTFAIVEKLQADSSGGSLNTTIKDRYFSAASATPASIFPAILRLNQHYLAKLDDRPQSWTQLLLDRVTGKVKAWPKTHSVEDQGLFTLGYFQQHEEFYRKRSTKGDSE